ncbi:TMV resistance protein N-like isoform X1 [Hibiscus syriacus]|uniref:TMV resistance protein N-like isoform X1 n=1 Tax=Hibiscus syriacus TaxID=106335 RepID=A0A6A2YIX4_HIBSY|nr:TMV resistance protein N-like isoform X1 [Hibiscus syriacus]
MNEVSHKRIKTNGIWLQIAEQGIGPLVLLLHGFPEIWYSWRHQITFLANHGYHVVAPGLRGYGDSGSPPSPSSYTNMYLVGDIIGLLYHFGEQQTDNLIAPPGMEIIDYLEIPSRLPPWMTEDELQVFADKFRESGFVGAFHYYRAME